MRITFCLEPALFRSNPAFLRPHLYWFNQILEALGVAATDTVTLISSISLYKIFEDSYRKNFNAHLRHATLDPLLAIASFDGSMPRYARDLYDDPEVSPQNIYLENQLFTEFAKNPPDLLICSSENRYVKRNLPAETLLFFIEKTPLPSWTRTNTLYFDPLGHQSQGTLSRRWQDILASSHSNEELQAAAAFIDEIEERKQAALASESVKRIAAELQSDRPVMLVALQPEEWLSWEGASPTPHRPLDLLLQVAGDFPEFQILPSFHKDMAVPDDAVHWLHTLRPNIPDIALADCKGTSEALMPLAEHVYCVSSAVGMTALLYGLNLVSDAKSYLSSAAVSTREFKAGKISRLSHQQRMSLAAFLRFRFGRDIKTMKSLSDYRAHAAALIPPTSPLLHKRLPVPRKFGVLQFSYGNYTHFRSIAAAGRPYTVNLGDYIQSLGVHGALRALGIPDSDIIHIDQDNLSQYTGKPVNLIMNGVFTPSNFPLAPQINPIFFGFSYHPENIIPADNQAQFEASLAYLAQARIGCRDKASAEILAARGFETFVSGCLSQSFEARPLLGREHLPVLICGIDDPDAEAWLMQAFPNHIRLRDQRRPVTSHPLDSQTIADCRNAAQALLDFYANNISMTFTSLMHCASPCAALGIPTAIIRRDPSNIRFSNIKEYLPVIAPGQLAEIGKDKLRAMTATLNRRQTMLDTLAAALANAAAA